MHCWVWETPWVSVRDVEINQYILIHRRAEKLWIDGVFSYSCDDVFYLFICTSRRHFNPFWYLLKVYRPNNFSKHQHNFYFTIWSFLFSFLSSFYFLIALHCILMERWIILSFQFLMIRCLFLLSACWLFLEYIPNTIQKCTTLGLQNILMHAQ